MPQYTSQVGRQLNVLDPESENILSDEELAAERDRLLSIYPQQWGGQERQMLPTEEPLIAEPIQSEMVQPETTTPALQTEPVQPEPVQSRNTRTTFV